MIKLPLPKDYIPCVSDILLSNIDIWEPYIVCCVRVK